MDHLDEKDIRTATIEDVGINPSGHRQELDRNFSLLSLCGFAISAGNAWIVVGGSVTVAIYNGGPPGVLYEFVAANFFYWFVAASLGELASAMPSSGGVYHWASITGGKHGRVWGWFAGWLNFWAWIFGMAGSCQILGCQVVAMYSALHPGSVTERWHISVAYFASCWIICFVVLFLNKLLPKLAALCGILIVLGVIISIVVCAVMPASRGGYATNAFVWQEWQNATGYGSDGFVFLLGMLNGAFAMGAPDVVSHLAEETRRPSKTIPKTLLVQYSVGLVSGFSYLVAILYSISDLDIILDSQFLFPLASIYQQATQSTVGTLCLLFCAFLPGFLGTIGVLLTVSRLFWTLARDNATPFAPFFAQVHARHRNPFNAVVFCSVISTLLGCIYIGSATAFNAMIGSYIILSCLSYLAAILPHLLSGRKTVVPGWFWMRSWVGFIVNAVACMYIIAFTVIFCFPFSLPVSAATMNYSSLLCGGLILFVAVFWFWRQRDFAGPKQGGKRFEEGVEQLQSTKPVCTPMCRVQQKLRASSQIVSCDIPAWLEAGNQVVGAVLCIMDEESIIAPLYQRVRI